MEKIDNGPVIERIEPPCWWIGMITPLQLMIHGNDVGSCTLESVRNEVAVQEVHTADSPNYLFADIGISPVAEPGIYEFILKK